MPGDWTKLIIGVGFWSLLGFWSKRGGQKEDNLKKEQLYGRGFIYLKTNAKLFMVMKNTFPNEVKSSQYSTSRVCDQQRWGSKKSGRGSSNRIVPVGSSTHWCYLTFLILYRMAGASWGEATKKGATQSFMKMLLKSILGFLRTLYHHAVTVVGNGKLHRWRFWPRILPPGLHVRCEPAVMLEGADGIRAESCCYFTY